MGSMTIRAYAKVNIGLKVLEKRNDGYHDIESFFHLVDLYDDIEIAFFEAKSFSARIEGNRKYLAEGGTDLMEKALRIFSERSGIPFLADIRIAKRIPSKAGLGGGSSDAGAVLCAASSYFNFPREELQEIALAVGSDVPFFTSGRHSARIGGRGEIVSGRPVLPYAVDLFFPSFFVETGGAYAKLDCMNRPATSLPDRIEGIPDPAAFSNDFELVTPRTDEIGRLASIYRFFSMSGSGSTYFGIREMEDRKTADAAAEVLCDGGTSMLRSRFL